MVDTLLERKKVHLWEIALLFLKIGVTSFGGPAAHISMMENEVVLRRKWITKQYFLDLVGATNLIPGPNATEMAIHIGYILRGWLGLAIAGICFIMPSSLIALGFAWVYVKFGQLPQIEPVLFGIRPVVLAIILGAIWRLGRKATKSLQLIFIGLMIIPFAFLFNQTIYILIISGIIGMVLIVLEERMKPEEFKKNIIEEPKITEQYQKINFKKLIISASIAAVVWGGLALISWLLKYFYPEILIFQIIFYFYGIGSILYGSGYVYYAYVRDGLVQKYKWLTNQQLIDTIAIGQFVPGPVLSSTTVIGYIINGYSGAFLATIAIFLPAFLVVTILNPLLTKVRNSKWAGAFLDAINVGSIAIMFVITFQFGQNMIFGLDIWNILVTITLFLVALVISIIWKKINPAFLVIGGALIGGLLKWFIL